MRSSWIDLTSLSARSYSSMSLATIAAAVIASASVHPLLTVIVSSARTFSMIFERCTCLSLMGLLRVAREPMLQFACSKRAFARWFDGIDKQRQIEKIHHDARCARYGRLAR